MPPQAKSDLEELISNKINSIDSQLLEFKQWTDDNWITLPDSIKSVLISGKIHMEEMRAEYLSRIQHN